jgi:hypothetical protein
MQPRYRGTQLVLTSKSLLVTRYRATMATSATVRTTPTSMTLSLALTVSSGRKREPFQVIYAEGAMVAFTEKGISVVAGCRQLERGKRLSGRCLDPDLVTGYGLALRRTGASLLFCRQKPSWRSG